jgi:hypothetical protein
LRELFDALRYWLIGAVGGDCSAAFASALETGSGSSFCMVSDLGQYNHRTSFSIR